MVQHIAQPASVDLVIRQGEEYLRTFTWEHEGEPVDLTDLRALAQVRKRPGGVLLLDLSPHMTVDPVEDTITLEIPATVTRDLVQNGVWDLFLIDVADEDAATLLAAGTVTVDPAVSVDE